MAPVSMVSGNAGMTRELWIYNPLLRVFLFVVAPEFGGCVTGGIYYVYCQCLPTPTGSLIRDT